MATMHTRYNPIHQITGPEIAALIRQAMRAGNTAEALNLFLQTGEKESLPLFEKFSEAHQQYERHLIGLEEWGQTQTQICHSILGMSLMVETEMRESPSSETKAKMLQLLLTNKTEQALSLCEPFGNQYLLLQAQLYTAKNQSGSGLIESEYFEATKSKINYTLLELMGQSPVNSVPSRSILSKLRSIFK